MHYGYGPELTETWNEQKKERLAILLSHELGLPIVDGRTYKPAWQLVATNVKSPYLEVDGTFGGVRIRKITHLSEDEREDITARADIVYDGLMRLAETPLM